MSLSGPYDPKNIFALILKGEEPCFRVFEDEAALAFLDIFPQADGHTLVLPKKFQARNLLDLPANEVGPFLERVQLVAHALVKALKPDGIEIQQLNGDAAGQTVFHLHFHIIPRTKGKKLIPHGEAPRADDTMLKAMAARIRRGFEPRP